MPEKDFSPEDSLRLISSMIDQAKKRFSENGHLYLVWGWAVFICSVTQFVMLKFGGIKQHSYVWFAMWLMWIYQAIYLRRKKKGIKVKGYADNILGAVWIVFVVLMIIFGLLIAKVLGSEYYRFINPAFLALYGMPTILSGVILQFRPLVIGGVICWMLALAATIIPYDYQLLLFPAGVVAAWIIPGYLMRIKYRKSL